MNNRNIFNVLVFLTALFAGIGSVSASTFEGKILQVRISNGPSTGVARVGVFVGAHATACSYPNWYAFDNADQGLGKVWTSAILTAYAAGKTVSIVGSGTCDWASVEGIAYIDVK